MKINLDKFFNDLDGNAVIENGQPTLLGKEFAKHLVMDSHKDSGLNALDVFETALKLNKGEEIDLKKGEQELYQKWIKNCATMTAILKGQILQELISQKETE